LEREDSNVKRLKLKLKKYRTWTSPSPLPSQSRDVKGDFTTF